MKPASKKRRTGNAGSGVLLAEAPRFRPGSVEAELEEIASKIPKRDLERLPRDLASNLDHYLYCRPKR